MSNPQPPVLPNWGSGATDSGDMVQPSNAQIIAGWPESSTPPERQYFNWFFNFVMGAINYFLQRGLSDYASWQTYGTNDRCIGNDGNTYVSLQDANNGHTPSGSPTWWATWGYTAAQLSGLFAPINSPTFTGVPLAPTPSTSDSSTRLATTAYVKANVPSLSGYAPINSPTFTGTPLAPTPAVNDNSTKIATTAYVVANALSPVISNQQIEYGYAPSGGTITFSSAFGAVPIVLLGAIGGTNDINTGSVTASQFVLASSQPTYWCAIGTA